MSKDFFSYAVGVGSKNANGQWLEVFYPAPVLNPTAAQVSALTKGLNYNNAKQDIELDDQALSSLIENAEALGLSEQVNAYKALLGSKQPRVLCLLNEDSAAASTPEAYLKLHLLSHRLVKPHGTDLTGIFAVLPNVAWTNQGAIDLAELPARQLEARAKGELLQVTSVDKFPKMADYVVPSGVRIAATSRVRLGAYLGEGTTVMHEGFCNFNAGTAGTSMVEGRISAGVFVGKGSDLGGGCSTMGTLSGGGNMVISVGEESLIGANAGTGIPLGDRCTIESGLYITAGTKVILIDENKQQAGTIKARELAGKSDLLFRRNSISGAIECLTNKTAIALNEELHAHN
ncbi:2,3,4,5-tetrahydropyridine-2,6-dicarboxylate N-succinyltransferase [Agarivorans gilvus]|jgi:2,3,4,5-tetrahydropyridine-2-carboxylate N-succinyltransferase|uniref:2,3,4,5-tetrahydropyridine-2,6-dicarboxylate N-succinyltransferase n=1 Tax=Agarivorans gilvus TaxID=680279 RepID=A0ABQ1HZX5_9ALTE|nr:2,3,4,5-tetrahydropyridine-2,6-dicarboxylate N-succinyltransferase [Agarivorans gilvus]GGB01575.1 2,3,4,5-tetrahydropyridine-2,6-dicarboxylate N-succinyltransferase [Agarivorans gilvus]